MSTMHTDTVAATQGNVVTIARDSQGRPGIWGKDWRAMPLWTPFRVDGLDGWHFKGTYRKGDGSETTYPFPFKGSGEATLQACEHAITQQKNKLHRQREGSYVPTGRTTANRVVALPVNAASRVIRTDDTVVIPRSEYADLIRKAALYDHLAQ